MRHGRKRGTDLLQSCVHSIREYQNFPNSYLLFTKVSMHLSISHSLCSAVHNYDSLCRRSSRSPIILSILLVMIHCAVQYIIMIHCAGVRSSRSPIMLSILLVYLYIYIRVVRRALNLLRASFSPIFQYFSAVNVYTRLSFSLTCMPYMAPCAMDSLAMEGAVHSHSDFRVRRSVVHRALNWLVTHNQYCRSNHVHIDVNPLQQLPHDGNLSTSLPSLLRTPSLNLLPPTLLQLVLLSPTPMELLKIHIVPTFHSLLFPLPLDL